MGRRIAFRLPIFHILRERERERDRQTDRETERERVVVVVGGGGDGRVVLQSSTLVVQESVFARTAMSSYRYCSSLSCPVTGF